MKKILFLLLTAFTLNNANAQIVISGIQCNPVGVDNNYEYIQFQATQDINFATNNYSVVTCLKSSDATVNGWATGGLVTYKFNLTSGSVTKGEFFYVGGSAKLYSGTGTASIASSKWIRAIDYTTTGGDDFGDANNDAYGILSNDNTPQPGPTGVAVFTGTTVTNTTVPIDVVFFGIKGPSAVSTTLTITNNDRYSKLNGSTPQSYFGVGTNTYMISSPGEVVNQTNGYFLKLLGNYDPTTATWITPRTYSWIATNSGSLSTKLETTSLITMPLPVSLTSFTAKYVGNKVQLNWATASENNNSHFDILRSADGINFSVISTVQGNGTSTVNHEYNYTDFSPLAGASYYQISQVDFNGTAISSKIVSANNTSDKKSSLNVATTDNAIKIFAYSNFSGKAAIQITDIYGRKLLSTAVNLEKGYNTLNLPVALITGVYVVSLQVNSEYINTKFFK